MYLKQLTLRGFKSFASATTLNFEPGITCVVGPNGSGKSNVVDALSWVMGEQGAKSLRGGKMEDVIFAGTSSRAPLGRAEVVLTIDNTDGALPIEYTEVKISRTMFRNGGSEYAINNHPARLLDVQELLSDSGIGREMHVIVGQGQLDTILQATPEIRRGFIEEAAGVLKHRKRKEKALRKLDSTKANLERLTDLIAEIRRQLRPLGRQAEVARKAAVIQAELRDAKSRLLAAELVAATDALEADLADEDALNRAKERAEADLSAANAAETAAEQALQASARQLAEANELWYALAALRERVATTLSISAERMRHGEAQPTLDVGGRDPDKLEREAKAVKEEEAGLRDAASEANSALTDATLRRNAAEAAHAEAEQRYATQMRAVADRREGLARLTGQVNSMKSRLDASAEEVDRLARRRDEALERAAAATREFHEHEAELAGLSGSESDLDETYEAALSLAEDLSAQLATASEAEAQLVARRGALAARLEALELAAQRKDGSADLLGSGLPGVAGRLPDLIRVEAGWEAATSAALSALAESVVVADQPAALAAVDLMRTKDLGRAGLLVGGVADDRADWPALPGTHRYLADRVEAPAEFAGTLARLLRHVVGVDDAAAAQALVAAAPHAQAVTRDGDVYSAWLVVGGSSSGPSLLEVQATIDDTRTQLEQSQFELDRLKFATAELSAKAADASAAEQAALADLHTSDAALAALADQLGRLRQTSAAAHTEADRLSEAIAQAAVAREADAAKLTELQARLEAASDEHEIVEPDSAERDGLGAKARQARTAEMEARLALRTAEERVKALSGRADSLLRAAQNERAARAKARARAEQLRREAEVARAVHAAALDLAQHVDRSRMQATAERDRAEQARVTADTAVVDARHRVRSATATLDELVKGMHRDELARIEQRMRIEQLQDRALSELGLEPEALMNDFGPHQLIPVLTRPDGTALQEGDEVPEPVRFDVEAQTKRLRTAERNLTVLGRVNPLALEEFEAMSQRHTFLAEQLDDLKRTRADLLDIIAQVDSKVEEVFAGAYADVERTFADVFGRLFPGGQGKLVLTDPGDMLNTGVGVEARPAGKQLKRLSLLSGGERSLVAVAFLVSLFIARPSPFYILDEVEAALDDANLGRLLGIYEELRASSQLLIITHQKRTMEIADSLYGVTMRGDGISTVVSQRLHD